MYVRILERRERKAVTLKLAMTVENRRILCISLDQLRPFFHYISSHVHVYIHTYVHVLYMYMYVYDTGSGLGVLGRDANRQGC